VSRATTCRSVRGKFGGNRSKESGRSGAWLTLTSQKTTPWRPFFSLSPKTIARFRWKRARLSLFRPQPHLPSFIQIHPSFRGLLAKTTFQIVIIYGDPSDRIADNNSDACTKNAINMPSGVASMEQMEQLLPPEGPER